MNNLDIINRAAAALNDRLPVGKAEVKLDNDNIFLDLMGKRYLCIIESKLTVEGIAKYTASHPSNVPTEVKTLYVTINASSKVMDFAKAPDVNILDCAGNFKIQYPSKTGGYLFMLANHGEPPVKEIEAHRIYPIFKDAGLKVIFYLLMDKFNIAKPFREIKNATGVAIGTVKNIIDGMTYHQFARIEGRKRFLTNVDRLLELWAANYGVYLKPRLLIANMKFRDNEASRNFQKSTLPIGMSWSGEAAAALTSGFITPGEFTIYTDVPAPFLLKTGAVLPDKDGEIRIYKKFWKDTDNKPIVPAVLTYADLIDTGNSRCIETAQMMKQHELAYLF